VPSKPRTQSQSREGSLRAAQLALCAALVLFVSSVWPALAYAPLGLDDQALLEFFAHADFGRVWGFDHFGHLRPAKNIMFWYLAHWPALLSACRALLVLAALGCAWLLRSVSLQLGLAPPWAALAAALWLLNPTTAVGVAWLSAGNYLLALAGTLLYVRALLGTSASGGRALLRAHLALLCAALSHELALLAPLWLLCHRGRTDTPAARKQLLQLGLAAVAVAAVPLVLRLLHTAPVLEYRSGLSAPQLMASAALNFAQNIALWLWLPGRFGVLLSQAAPASAASCVGAWLGVLALGGLLWRLGQRDALLWLLIFLVPVVNLLPLGVTPLAMHYLILPGVGLAWLVARGLAQLASRRQRQAASVALVLGVALLLSWQPAFRRTVSAFGDEISLYEATLQDRPDNREASVNLIAAQLRAGNVAQAEKLLHEALQRAPSEPGLLRHQLQLLLLREQLPEALAWFAQHADWVQRDSDLSLRRGLLLRRLGENAEAARLFQHVLAKTAPTARERALAGYQLANLHVQSGRLPEAQALLRSLHDDFPGDRDIALALRLVDDVLRR
jgi:tetratricopeptide (TPR) repeat protein